MTGVTACSKPYQESNGLVNHNGAITSQQEKSSRDIKTILRSAADAVLNETYRAAAHLYKNAVDLMIDQDEKAQSQHVILTQYMLCICWIELDDPKNLLDALTILKELAGNYGTVYPMLYYAIAKAYSKLYRFHEADSVLKKVFSALNGNVKPTEYNIPETNIVIPESRRERLVAGLISLHDHCSSWHRPDAVCCMPDCVNKLQNNGADKNIFFRSPTFNGMVHVICNNPSNYCNMNFHPTCWKVKKESLCSVGKLSDKDIIHWECFTPNCESQGERCTIKKIEIFDDKAEIKASIESRPDDLTWHAKPPQVPKGAIRKQQKTSLLKEPRPPMERSLRFPVNRVKATKVEEKEDDDYLHEELALKSGIEKLRELRANNFGIEHDAIWRPNLAMYGNELMLETAHSTHDPDFSEQSPQIAEMQDFFFSYFSSFLSNNGPVKLDRLTEVWNEAKIWNEVMSNCVLDEYVDIKEFLLQSVNFAVIGSYICMADKLPEAYELTRTDGCELLRFLMENDQDERSNCSSIDGDEIFNRIVSHEKNNNTMPCSPFSIESNSDEKSTSPVDPMDNDTKRSPISEEIPKNVEEPYIEKKNELLQLALNEKKSNLSLKLISNVQVNESVSKPENVSNKATESSKSTAPKIDTPTKNPGLIPLRNHKLPDTDIPKSVENTTNTIKIEHKQLVEKPMDIFNGFHRGYENERELSTPEPQPDLISNNLHNNQELTSNFEAGSPDCTNNSEIFMNRSGETCNSQLTVTVHNHTILPTPSKETGLVTLEDDFECYLGSEWRNDVVGIPTVSPMDEMEMMRNELKLLKEQYEHNISELAHAKKIHVAMRVRMLQKILQWQYQNNTNLIKAHLDACEKDYKSISGIQKILMNSIGQTLPINMSDWSKVISEIQQASRNLEKKFLQVNEQLCNCLSPEKLADVNLPPETLPALPKLDLVDTIQTAIGMYRMHQMKEFQQMRLIPCMMPSVPTPTQFMGPQFPPYSDYVNMTKLIPTNASYHASNQQNYGTLGLSPQNLCNPPNFRYVPPQQMTGVKRNIPLKPNNNSIMQQQFPTPFHTPDFFANTNSNYLNQTTVFTSEPTSNSVPDKTVNSTVPQTPPVSFKQEIPALVSAHQKTPMQQNACVQREQKSTSDIEENYKFIEKLKSELPKELITSVSKKSEICSVQESASTPIEQTAQQPIEQRDIIPIDKQTSRLHFQSVLCPLQQNDQTEAAINTASGISDVQVESQNNSYSQDNENQQVQHDTAQQVVQNDPSEQNSNVKKNKFAGKNKTIMKRKCGMDKLMEQLRIRFSGVLESDTLNSVEQVRRNHNNSLTGMQAQQIIRETEKYINEQQKNQVCTYPESQPANTDASSMTIWVTQNYERKRQSSISSTSSVNSVTRESQSQQKRTWEPLTDPNQLWHKESQELECIICMENMDFSMECYTLKCQHTFHKLCIKNWFQQNQTCPTCRVYSTIDDDYPPL